MHSAREAFDGKLAAGCSPRVALIAGMKAVLQNFNPGVEFAPGVGASMVRDLEDEIGVPDAITKYEAAAYCAGFDHAVSLFGPDVEKGPNTQDFHKTMVALMRQWGVPGTMVATAVLDDRSNTVLASAMFELADVEPADEDVVDLIAGSEIKANDLVVERGGKAYSANPQGAGGPHPADEFTPKVPAPADANGHGEKPCPICGKYHQPAA